MFKANIIPIQMQFGRWKYKAYLPLKNQVPCIDYSRPRLVIVQMKNKVISNSHKVLYHEPVMKF